MRATHSRFPLPGRILGLCKWVACGSERAPRKRFVDTESRRMRRLDGCSNSKHPAAATATAVVAVLLSNQVVTRVRKFGVAASVRACRLNYMSVITISSFSFSRPQRALGNIHRRTGGGWSLEYEIRLIVRCTRSCVCVWRTNKKKYLFALAFVFNGL